MSHRGLVTLPPTAADVAISRACARAATPAAERVLGVITWAALAAARSLAGAGVAAAG